MKRVIIAAIVLSFISLPSFAFAYTIVNTAISTDTTWSPAGGVYVIDEGFSVAPGITLTINPGTIIKSRAAGYNWLNIYGTIVAHGASGSPIYFTSFWDDSIGGDTDGNGPDYGSGNHWQGLYFKPGSVGDFDYVDISHAGVGGYGTGDYVGIENDGGDLLIKHSNIHDNYIITSNGAGGSMSIGSGIYNKNGTLSVSDSVINNNVYGIRVESGTTTISNNVIRDNVDSTGYGNGYGVYAYGPEPLTLLNNIFVGNRRTASVSASKNFTHSGNTSADQTNRGFEMGGIISEDTTFTSGDLPYIIQGLTIADDKTLTIEPGTILKMDDRYSSGAIYVQGGNLIAHGTPDKKIYITSLKDDSVGGDTNGDGNTTSPRPKDWSSLFFELGSKVDFDNVTVSYGGWNYNGEYLNIAAAIYQRGAEFSVSNSVFEHNSITDIFQDAGTTNITNSELINGNYGIWSRGGSIKISQSSLTGNTGLAIYNESGPTIDALNNWWGKADGPYDISTTTLTGTGDKISGDILYIPFLTTLPGSTPPPQTIDPVIIIPGIMGSATKNGKLVIDPILHTYDDLIATLKANGYEEGKDLFTFPYEWRDSNVLSANLLKDKINEVKTICDCSKVDLVAHSMGGLVAREYIQSGQYNHDVDQVIFLGTPHNGSPKAYLQWEAGEFPPGIREFLTQQIFVSESRRNGYPDIFDYIHNRPILSVQELLPTFDYLKDKSTGVLRTYPDNYPRNTFLENLDNNISILLNSGVKITNIIGDTGNSTIKNIIVTPSSDLKKWINGEMSDFELGAGDSTVTDYGSTLDSFIPNEKWNGVSHGDLPRETSARVFNLLTGKIASSVIYLTPIEKIFSIQLQSPIDVVVTAPDGKKVGKKFSTGEEYNEIPGAFYSGFNNGDDECITIPNPLDGNYKIEVQGTGNGGKYGILTSYISDNFATTTETTGVTKPNQITELNVMVDNQNPVNLETERKITMEVLINDINGAYDLKWIKDAKTRDTLVKQVKGAIKFNKKIDIIKEKQSDGSIKEKRIEKFEIKVNKILSKLFIVGLQALLKKKMITQDAFNLIRSDVEYLINN